ncbi:EAL domain-containing protein [Roseibium sp. FZY0029]|uniref:EAL domain-containing protein n=1 Tax=Roseibium sp. FZY0029 TaxID=3116647 RepID=UPI002EAE108C|nr:EAL domain-containing protein [Roseibium sp. FZY0029]
MLIVSSEQRKRIASANFIVIGVIAAVAVLRSVALTTAFDRFLWEVRFQTIQRPVTGDLVVVDIDAKSLNELGVWPLPRRLYAELTDHLAEAGARDIVFDIDFSSASNPEDDALFADAIERAGNVSLAMFQQAASAEQNAGEVVNQPIDELLKAAWPVVVMVPMETDSRIWRNLYGYEINGNSEISAAALLGEHTGKASGSFGLDYSISLEGLDRVSLVDVLKGTTAPGLFLDKKVIVGASAQELRDLFPVPVYDVLPGSVIQALGVETLLQNRAIEIRGEWIAVLLAVFVFFVLLLTKVEGWALKISILSLCAIMFEIAAIAIQKSSPILLPTASAHLILILAAASIVMRELGFHKFLSHIANVKRRNSERMLGQVFDDSFDAIVVLQSDGRVSAASQMARKLFQSETLVGKAARTVLPLELVEEALSVLSSSGSRQPVTKVLDMRLDDGRRRFIEYVVTRSEHTVAKTKKLSDVETEAVACLTCRDVTEEKESAERLAYLARFDPSTGLFNRNGFEEEVAATLNLARGTDEDICLVQFAIANFDQIVASLGFSYGDQLRETVAMRLKSHLSARATWGAMTADVFAGVFRCERDQDLALIELLQEVIGEDYKIEGARISVQLKFGYIVSDGDITPERLMKKSGNALAKVRRDNRSPVLRFLPEMDVALQRRRQLETELFKAIARDELHMVYQPLTNLSDGSIFGVEALLRWDHRELGPISPVEFVPIAEENGYIVELGAWALNRAMKEAMTWSNHLRLSINVSAIQFSRGNLVATVGEALQRTGFPSERLDLEITESLFIDETLDLQFAMEEMRAFGCNFSLDDFGTGYSSLGYLPKYPFTKIKLDKTFVRETIAKKQDVSVIEAVLHMAKGHEMSVIVEGIETAEQADRLREMGCVYGQGYFFGRPMSSAQLQSLLLQAA